MWRWVCLSMCVGMIVAPLGCSSSDEQRKDDEQVIGAPPSDTDDPFDVVRMPESARQAAKSGVIGEEDGESSVEEKQESLEKLAKRAEDAEPNEETFPEAESEEHRCFACVKICPESGEGTETCRARSEDVICGWGVHPEAETAREAARAECTGALELMRSSDRWGEIKGGCPEATCR